MTKYEKLPDDIILELISQGDADAEEAASEAAETVEIEPAGAEEKGLRKAKVRPRSRKQ